MRSGGKIACAGFPDGLSWIGYSGRWTVFGHEYKRAYVVRDIAGQVVGVEFLNQTESWEQPEPQWKRQSGNWRVLDYVNAEVKGRSDIEIVTQVLDERRSKRRIVVHTTSRKIGRSATLFLPEPLVNLMLHCVRDVKTKARSEEDSAARKF
jgi:hypothetical protein